MTVTIGRRELLATLGGAVAWPFAARAQQPQRIRRVGVLVPQGEDDPEQRAWVSAFVTRLEELGWKPGENIQLDYRWAAGDTARMPLLAKEIVGLKPDVILAATVTAAVAFRQYTLIIPIVFTQVADPVAAGLVTNLARPEGNVTGFSVYEFSISGKWIEALRECVPGLARAAILFDPGSLPWAGYMRSVEAAARPLGVQLIPFPVQSDADIEQAFARFATEPKLGAIVLPTASTLRRRKKIISLAEQRRLPMIYPYRLFAKDGGLMSYGIDLVHQHREAGTYVDRILKGASVPSRRIGTFSLAVRAACAFSLGIAV